MCSNMEASSRVGGQEEKQNITEWLICALLDLINSCHHNASTISVGGTAMLWEGKLKIA
jgi:hypothetical protein